MPNSTAEFRRRLRDLRDDLPPNLDEGIHDVMEQGVFEMRQLLLSRGSIWTGRLYDSIRTHRGRTTRTGSKKITRHNLIAGGREYGAEHAPIVEFGSGVKSTASTPTFSFESPDNPPVQKIKAWLEAQPSVVTPAPNALVFSVVRSIERFGTESQPFFRPIARKVMSNARDRAESELEEEIENF